MKKFLSLVMALALTVSLFTISAGAKDFTDKSSINYKEAVDVISALGVVGGYNDGSFAPTGTLTRGAAAKIICNLVLGPTTGSSLGVNSAPFKDVSTSNVFAGYIAYCSQQKIINGYADGTFKPAATVTGFQFMKMLLGALGYDGSVEGFTGSNWTVAVAKLAVSIGLDDGNDNFVGSKAMTREEAALYAYNTLKATMVEYDTTGTTIVVGGTTITQGASKASEVKNNATASSQTIKHDTYMQFAEKYFKDLKLLSTDTDAFERPANTWTYKSTTIGTYAKDADASYTATVKLGTIYSDLGLGKTVAASNVTGFIDGTSDSTLSGYSIAKGNTTEIGGNGVLTEVYYDSDAETIVITEVHTYAGEVKGVHAATSSKDAYINVSPLASGVGSTGTFDTTESFSVDEAVLYTYSNKTGEKCVESVVKAEQVTGTMTSYTAEKSATVGGTTYKANKAYSASLTDFDSAVDYEVTLTLDQYGYVTYVDTDKATGNYAVVLRYSGTALNDQARLLLADGTIKNVTLKDNTTMPSAASGTSGMGLNDIVSYKVNSDGEYTLTLLADSFNTTTYASNYNAVTKGVSTVSNYAETANKTGSSVTASAFNGKTIFLVKDNAGDYKAYTGIANAPDVVVNATKQIPMAIYVKTVASSTGVATVVYVDASSSTAATVSSSSKDVVFVKGSKTGASYDSTKGNYYNYTAIVNGEITTIDTITPTADDTLYTSVSYDKNKVATLSGKVNASNVGSYSTSGAFYGKGTAAENNDVIGLGNSSGVLGYYSYADDCKVFVKNTDGDISVGSIGSISADSNDLVFAKFVDSEVSTLVIVEKDSDSTPTPTVDTSNYKVITNGTVVTDVNYYTTAANDDLTLLGQIQAYLKTLGYTSFSISYADPTYTIKATNGTLTLDYTWANTAKTACVKVSVNNTAMLFAEGSAITALGSGKYVKIDGATPVLASGAGNIVDGKSYDIGYYLLTVDGTESYLKVGATKAISGTGTGYVTGSAYTAYGTYTMTAADTTIVTGYVKVTVAASAAATGLTNATDKTSTITTALKAGTNAFVKAGSTASVVVTATSSAAANAANGIGFTAAQIASTNVTVTGTIANAATTGDITVALTAAQTAGDFTVTLTAADVA